MAVHNNGREPIDPVAPEDACPNCGERDSDALIWLDDDRGRCTSCGTVYRPPGGSAATAEPEAPLPDEVQAKLAQVEQHLAELRAMGPMTGAQHRRRELQERIAAIGGEVRAMLGPEEADHDDAG